MLLLLSPRRLQVSNPIRILFAIPELDSGGPDRVFFELISGLDRTIFAPLLMVSRADGRYFRALPEDVDIYEIDGGRYPVLRFARAVDRVKPDVIISTLRMNITAAAARFFQSSRPPLIARQANAISANFQELRKRSSFKYGVAEWLIKRLLTVPDVLVAQSSDMGSELAELATDSQRIVVIGNPIDAESVRTAAATQKKQLGCSSFGDPALVAVGRLVPQKGFDYLLSAFAEMRKSYPNAGLAILGEGPGREDLELDLKRLAIEEFVRLKGHSETVLAEVDAADLFVSSSRYEGFSNAILEAMALGKPVVATNCDGGTKDMVIDGQTGILARAQSTDSLTEALLRAMKSDLSELSEAGQKLVESRFSQRIILSSYELLFQSLLDTRKHLKTTVSADN